MEGFARQDTDVSLPPTATVGARSSGSTESLEGASASVSGKANAYTLADRGRAARGAKRGLDLLVASLVLLIGTPFLLLVAIAIKLDSSGPILFRQTRVGRGGRPFSMLKLRTMHEGADERRTELSHLNENDGVLFKIRRDPRVTRVGKLLRPLSFDELPQLIHVLTGTMTLVGPRPMPPEMDALIDGPARRRLLTRPGITGVWQLDETWRRRSLEEMAKMDLEYVDSWTLRGDLKLLARTLLHIRRRRGI
jgi:lipopolysaccharide/colanic/teichoic acid biosynthesis glycosyltransferase